MTMQEPEWLIPKDIVDLIDVDGGEIWEDGSWDPILLSVMRGTVYRGRPIPLAWQIEFEPVGPLFEAGNLSLQTLGLDQDGYGWASLIKSIAEKYHPDLATDLQFGDTEESTCVVWVESEDACQRLMQMTWALINAA